MATWIIQERDLEDTSRRSLDECGVVQEERKGFGSIAARGEIHKRQKRQERNSVRSMVQVHETAKHRG